MQFHNYIYDLLYRYDCIIIPNFGAFLCNRTSAKLYPSTQTFYPPKKIISFNENLISNDGLLANYISEVEKMPYESALAYIEKEVEDLKLLLKKGESVSFENVGCMTYNSESKIVFEPSYQTNFLADAFGLSHFDIAKIDRKTNLKENSEIEKAAPHSNGNEDKQIQNKTSIFGYAAASILLIASLGLFGYNVYSKEVEKHNSIVTQEALKKVNVEVQEANFLISNPLPVAKLKLKKRTGNFHIMAGVFRFEENCNNTINELKSKGYNSRSIGKTPSGLYQVVYGSYATKEKADQALIKIKKDINPDAWVIKKVID